MKLEIKKGLSAYNKVAKKFPASPTAEGIYVALLAKQHNDAALIDCIRQVASDQKAVSLATTVANRHHKRLGFAVSTEDTRRDILMVVKNAQNHSKDTAEALTKKLETWNLTRRTLKK